MLSSCTRHCIVGAAPEYLTELCRPVSSSSGRQSLRSDPRGDLIVPRFRLRRSGYRAFAVSGPHVWNSLPTKIIYKLLFGSRPENDIQFKENRQCTIILKFTLLYNRVTIHYISRVNCKHFGSSSHEPFCGSISNEGALQILYTTTTTTILVSEEKVGISRGWGQLPPCLCLRAPMITTKIPCVGYFRKSKQISSSNDIETFYGN